MAITKFDAFNAKHLRNELENTLNEFAEKHGLKAASLGNISYTDNILNTGKISFATAVSQMPVNAPLLSYVGKKYKHGNRIFTILGVKEGKLEAITQRNARYLITPEQICDMIKL